MKIKKKLIEVALPLDAINKASSQAEKNPFAERTSSARYTFGGRVGR